MKIQTVITVTLTSAENEEMVRKLVSSKAMLSLKNFALESIDDDGEQTHYTFFSNPEEVASEVQLELPLGDYQMASDS